MGETKLNMGTIIHQGILTKSPPERKSKDLSRWKKRYFKLWSSKKLEYYRNERSEKPLKPALDLTKCCGIDGDLKNKKWNNIFCLNMDYRKFYLVANSKECMKKWISEICKMCEFSVEDSFEGQLNTRYLHSPLNSPIVGQKETYKDIVDLSESPDSTPNGSLDLPSISPYNEDLPPIPNSPNINGGLPDVPGDESPPLIVGSPFGKHMKQNRQNVDPGSPGSTYDFVPKPRLAVEEPACQGSYMKRRKSTPTQSAMKNLTIKDESYVDMQADVGNYDFVTRRSSGTMLSSENTGSSYDFVPPPRPLKEQPNNLGNCDIVPQSNSITDEYISCDLKQRTECFEAMPPVPDATYTGFDTLPTGHKLRQKPTRNSGAGNEIYDVPPRNFSEADSIYDTPPVERNRYNDSLYDTPPPFKEGNSNSDSAYDARLIPAEENRYSDSIYDTPPLPGEGNRYSDSAYDARLIPGKENRYNDSIYGTPPFPGEGNRNSDSAYDARLIPGKENRYSDSIYDTPPLPGEGNRYSDSAYDARLIPGKENRYSDSIYDTPPLPGEGNRNSDSAYDTRLIPGKENRYSDSIYDTPPLPGEGNRNSDSAYDAHLIPAEGNRYSDSIYDTPPLPGEGNRNSDSAYDARLIPAEENRYSDSIYDTPPVQEDNSVQYTEDSIYDTPPIQDNNALYDTFPPKQLNSHNDAHSIKQRGTRRAPYGSQNGHVMQDSLYDVPPNFGTRQRHDDSIYDTPPSDQNYCVQDEIYDCPQSIRSPLSDLSETAADLFDFGSTCSAPRVDRTLKYASTSDLDVGINIPPAVDRKSRPALTASVPTFPSEIEGRYRESVVPNDDSIYDCPPPPIRSDRMAFK